MEYRIASPHQSALILADLDHPGPICRFRRRQISRNAADVIDIGSTP